MFHFTDHPLGLSFDSAQFLRDIENLLGVRTSQLLGVQVTAGGDGELFVQLKLAADTFASATLYGNQLTSILSLAELSSHFGLNMHAVPTVAINTVIVGIPPPFPPQRSTPTSPPPPLSSSTIQPPPYPPGVNESTVAQAAAMTADAATGGPAGWLVAVGILLLLLVAAGAAYVWRRRRRAAGGAPKHLGIVSRVPFSTGRAHIGVMQHSTSCHALVASSTCERTSSALSHLARSNLVDPMAGASASVEMSTVFEQQSHQVVNPYDTPEAPATPPPTLGGRRPKSGRAKTSPGHVAPKPLDEKDRRADFEDSLGMERTESDMTKT